MDDLQQFITKQPCYEQHVIEIKKIYESRLFSILTPNIYEGFMSLYNIAQKFELKFTETMKNNPNVEKMSVLVIFQKLINDIPNLTTHKIKGETERIKTASRSADIFNDLVKAVIKANIILMTYNVDCKRKDLIQTRFYESVIVHDFVHMCFIESARVFHAKPELFWTGYDNILINKNKQSCYEIIENAIRESINQTLPMKEILSEYLTNPYEMKDDIRIYVIGNKTPETDISQYNHSQYPGNFNGNADLIDRGDVINTNNEEFMKAADLIDRDLGINIGSNRLGESLLESDNENNNFDAGENIDTREKSNLSVLLGSDSEINKNYQDSLLEPDNIKSITPVDISDASHSHVSNLADISENGSSIKSASQNSINSINSQNQVKDGIKMVNLKTVQNGRGQAKLFFNEILPGANKKADVYRKKNRENKLADNNSSDKSLDNLTKNISSEKQSEQAGIKIVRKSESVKSHKVNNKELDNKYISSKKEDITTDNVEDMVNNILKK
jgi:hypothetical protein